MKMKNLQLPNHAIHALYALKDHGFDAYIVGGFVRDNLIMQDKVYLSFPNMAERDIDITTSATAEDVAKIFPEVRKIDKGDRTVLVVFRDKNTLEISTFQGENIKEDLNSRDFTVNAFALDIDKNVICASDGCPKDLKEGFIDTVNDEAFDKDPLRMMRAIRFGLTLGFTIEPYVKDEIKAKAHMVKNVAPERIKAELCKSLLLATPGTSSRYFRELNILGLLEYILPELHKCVGFEQFNENHDKCVFEHTLDVVDYMPNTLKGKLAALFHDIGKINTFSKGEDGVGHFINHPLVSARITSCILNRLHFSNDLTASVVSLVKAHHEGNWKGNNKSITKFINSVGKDNLFTLLDLKRADALAKSPKVREDRVNEVAKLVMVVTTLLEKKVPLNVTDLAIKGSDVMACGFSAGPKIGVLLRDALNEVITGKIPNERIPLISFIKGIRKSETAVYEAILGGFNER